MVIAADACCYATGCTALVTVVVVGGGEAWAPHRPAGSECTLVCRAPPAAVCLCCVSSRCHATQRSHGIMLTDLLADISSCLHCLGGATAQTPETSSTMNVLGYHTPHQRTGCILLGNQHSRCREQPTTSCLSCSPDGLYTQAQHSQRVWYTQQQQLARYTHRDRHKSALANTLFPTAGPAATRTTIGLPFAQPACGHDQSNHSWQRIMCFLYSQAVLHKPRQIGQGGPGALLQLSSNFTFFTLCAAQARHSHTYNQTAFVQSGRQGPCCTHSVCKRWLEKPPAVWHVWVKGDGRACTQHTT